MTTTSLSPTSLQSDIQEYKSARNQADALYAEIGTDRDTAVAKRSERWAVNKRKREAAENIIMAMLGNHKPALQRAGLVDLYNEMAAGTHECDAAFFAIVDATVQFFDK
jgi:hypothetical protein